MPKKIIKDKLPNSCFFFGYGSLMYAKGINGRGMNYHYKNNDLIPLFINGLSRTMSAEVALPYYNNVVRFYSVDFKKNSKVFGMYFKINSKYDLKILLENEGSKPFFSNGCYTAYDISDLIPTKLKLPMITLISKELKDNPKLYYPGYIKKVFNGISPKYRLNFLNTGGLHPNKLE